jgi:hypothetical protein
MSCSSIWVCPGCLVSRAFGSQSRGFQNSLTNPSAESEIGVRLRLAGDFRPPEAKATVLAHSDPAAANTFAAPEQVKPAPLSVAVADNRVNRQAAETGRCVAADTLG